MRNRERKTIVGIMIDITLNFLGLFILMYYSELLVETPIFGGALFTAGQFWAVYARLYNKNRLSWLPTSMRVRGAGLFALSLLLNLILVIAYPSLMSRPSGLFLIAALALFIVWEIVTDMAALRLDLKRFRPFVVQLAVHLLFIVAIAAVLWLSGLDQGKHPAWAPLLVVGAILMVKQVFFVFADEPGPKPDFSSDDMLGVHAYRLYNRMLISVFMAVNLSVTMYICYLRYLPYSGFLDSMLGLLFWLMFVLTITATLVRVISRRSQWRFDKPATFLVGVALWVVPTVLVFNGTVSMIGYELYLVGGLYGAGLACMLSIIVALGMEMKDVVKIGVGEFDDRSYVNNTLVMVEWSSLLSSLLLLVMLTVASFTMDGKMAVLDKAFVYPEVLQLISLLLPMVFVLAALVLYARQPLDREYARKLHEYRRQLKKGERNTPLEERLRKALVASTPKRIGIRILKMLVRPFIPLRIRGKENVSGRDMPVVFICNHFEVYGPIAAIVRMPFYVRPWIIHLMLERDIVEEAMKGGVDTVLFFLPKSWRRKLRRVAAPVVLWMFRSLDPIPVYHTDMRGLARTMKLTVEALECNDNILLFPENSGQDPGGQYAVDGSVSQFYSGFANIGRAYYQKTKKRVTFIPVYINKQKRTMTFGQGVRYDPEKLKTQEKQRIVEALHTEMERMAES